MIVQAVNHDVHGLEFPNAGVHIRELEESSRGCRRCLCPRVSGIQIADRYRGIRDILFFLIEYTFLSDVLNARRDLGVDVCHRCRVACLERVQTCRLGGDSLQWRGVKVVALDGNTEDDNVRFAIPIRIPLGDIGLRDRIRDCLPIAVVWFGDAVTTITSQFAVGISYVRQSIGCNDQHWDMAGIVKCRIQQPLRRDCQPAGEWCSGIGCYIIDFLVDCQYIGSQVQPFLPKVQCGPCTRRVDTLFLRGAPLFPFVCRACWLCYWEYG